MHPLPAAPRSLRRWWIAPAIAGCVVAAIAHGATPAGTADGGGKSSVTADAAATEPLPPAAPVTASGPFVRVLGTVQDGGLPHAACTCERCELARHQPDRRRYVASLALAVPATRQVFLFDATPDLRPQLDLVADLRDAPPGRVDRQPVDGVFLTHAHIGHYLGLAFFGFEAVNTSRLPVYATSRMAAFLRANGPWSQLVELQNVDLEEVVDGRPVELPGGVRVTPFRAPHRDEYADTVGYLLEGPRRRLLYLPDTDSWLAWKEPLDRRLEGIDVALLDGTFYSADELPGRDVASIGHPLITTTMDLLQGLVDRGGTRVFFTHLNHSNPALGPGDETRRTIEARGFAVLVEGQEFPL